MPRLRCPLSPIHGDRPDLLDFVCGMKSDGTKWILVVEDEDDNRDALIEILHEASYQAKGVADGAAALELLRTARPCLVLADFALGDMNGKELRQRVRDLLGPSAPPFVLLTGMPLSELEDISGTILMKPIEGDHLLGVVAQHCQRP
jgi:DNA-binding response OmpR family regulator